MMDALYDEDFALLNKDRISALSYTAGVLVYETHEPSNLGCPKMPAAKSLVMPQNVFTVSIYALYNGREYEPGAFGQARAGFDMLGLDDPTRVFGPFGAGSERQMIAQDGFNDARDLLANYGGCSGAIFKRVYSGNAALRPSRSTGVQSRQRHADS